MIGEFEYIEVSVGKDPENWQYVCGLRPNGTIECWGGGNEYGQVEAPIDKFTSVSAGAVHTCGLRRDGTARCWGFVGSQLGEIGALEGVFTSVSAGGWHSCGLRSGGSVECWVHVNSYDYV